MPGIDSRPARAHRFSHHPSRRRADMAHGDITHIDIPVGDLDRASRFYSELFGWQISEVPGFEGYPMWQAPNKVSGGGLAPRGEGFTQPRSYVEVDSIDEDRKSTRLNSSHVASSSAV